MKDISIWQKLKSCVYTRFFFLLLLNTCSNVTQLISINVDRIAKIPLVLPLYMAFINTVNLFGEFLNLTHAKLYLDEWFHFLLMLGWLGESFGTWQATLWHVISHVLGRKLIISKNNYKKNMGCVLGWWWQRKNKNLSNKESLS